MAWCREKLAGEGVFMVSLVSFTAASITCKGAAVENPINIILEKYQRYLVDGFNQFKSDDD